MKMSLKDNVNIIGIGVIASIMIFFIVYIVFAKSIYDLFIFNSDSSVILFVIILGFILITFIVSILISLLVSSNVSYDSIFKASIYAFISNIVMLILVSYIGVYLLYPVVFYEIQGPSIFIIVFDVVVYFSIYVLSHPLYLSIISIIIYYIFYTFYINVFYKFRSNYK